MNTPEFKITNFTKGASPNVSFLNLKNEVLGKKYELSLVFIGSKRSQKLNKTYRNKSKPTNVLSFPISRNSGEIFIDLQISKNQATKFNRTFSKFVGYLFIHGLFHLKGMEHGLRMERAEKKLQDKYKI